MTDPRIGTSPLFTNLLGQSVYWIEGAPHGIREESDVYLLCLHHTQGSDSRTWLAGDGGVSATYLVGEYADTNWKPRIYKYLSERSDVPYTQGYGSIGGVYPNINTGCISIEVEGPKPLSDAEPQGFSPDLLGTVASLCASIIADWHNARGRSLLVLGHDHIDDIYRDNRHTDPAFDWSRMLQMIYSRLPALVGYVPGWNR